MIKDQTLRGARLLTALVIAAVLLTGFVLYQLRFGGPIERKHALQSEMLADILPPPAFVVEPYLETTLATENTNDTKRALAHLRALEQDFRERRDYWARTPLPDDIQQQLDRVEFFADEFWRVVDGPFTVAAKARDRDAMYWIHVRQISHLYELQHKEVLKLVALSRAYTQAEMQRDSWIVLACLMLSALMALLLVGALRWATRQIERKVIEPLEQTSRTIGCLGEGDYEITIEGTSRTDEFGTMARSMDVFRKAGIEKAATEEEQRRVVERRSVGLRKLADKDLEHRICEEFSEDYETLRSNYNQAVTALCRAMGTVRVGAGSVMNAISEIRAGADDLARRNQKQAASLEETAAALGQVTGRIQGSARAASEAHEAINDAHDAASEGGNVVRDAVAAMAAIDSSAKEISSIIDLIDSIAFQTNLLALNAGVEAARAGEAGKGFAVVATEVRALAQRSAEAANQIKQLITRSAAQVGEGVSLVGRTGESLAVIVERVSGLQQLVADMARSTREQSADLEQVNTAIGEMDRMTQQNAAMVEQTTAATRNLEGEATSLSTLTSSFRTRMREARPVTTGTDSGEANHMRRSSAVGTAEIEAGMSAAA